MKEAGAILPRHERPSIIPNEILGMLIFGFTEIMFFAALISSLLVIKGGNAGLWVPPSGIKLPVIVTAVNTANLLLSGILVVLCEFLFRKANKNGSDPKTVAIWIGLAAIMGGLFVAFQGYEWVKLLSYGLTMQNSIFGACFYLLIGTHALHAFAGAVLLVVCLGKLLRGTLKLNFFRAVMIFWLLVVGVWPVLYGNVYF